MLKPHPAEDPLAEGYPCGDPAQQQTAEADSDAPEAVEETEFAKLNNQFVIPIVTDGLVSAMVVMSISLEIELGARSAVFAVEPKLRDAFLQAMFNHANIGGFSGNFTSGTKMRSLRSELLRVARDVVSGAVIDVLITDIVRQDT
ncbi:flagellar basal body-associated FliL family protein [Yoonia sediminilitoris]|uniref:Flagellar protein FliL n=1 Tax=Yoonia sediminilitoris TaxID=1286148 RepID=A0A2T6KA96_9RHOB|nr:flagellar basal body-associated FliL family protein [Yoonia sediminilitoris]PUB11775.1 hypothetical protein C8N45_11218 [Yoonia sediminilitoris]RCW91852.1 hypothetical protein DFP92_11218 [Yoonia sediminilitoris]